MFRAWPFAAAGCLLLGGCWSSAPPPVSAPVNPTAADSQAASKPANTEAPRRDQETSHAPTSATASDAKSSLRELAERLVVSDGKGGWRIAEQPATELEKLGPQATEDLLPLLRDPAAPVRRGAAFYLLGKFDPAKAEHVAAFSTLLDDEDQTLRGFGLSAVQQMRTKDQIEAVPRLTGMLTAMRENKPENRAAIARLIGGLKREAAPAADSLAGAAADDPDPKVRAACLAAIVQVAEPGEVIAPLANGLTDQDPAVRLVAAARLRQLGAAASPASKQLAAAMGDDDQRVREAAAEALIRIGADAVEPVTAQLSSPNLSAKSLALACLAKIGPAARSALPAIEKCKMDADPVVRKLAEAAIKRIEM